MLFISDLPSWAVASFKAQTDIVGTVNRAYRIPFRKNLGCELNDAEFIAHSRIDVPELARRLKKACDILREIQSNLQFTRGRSVIFSETFIQFIKEEKDELEAMPVEK